MKTDAEVQLMLRERNKGKTLEQAAARAGMSVPTARKYLRSAKLPSALRQAPRREAMRALKRYLIRAVWQRWKQCQKPEDWRPSPSDRRAKHQQ
jgi:hypothetical protein